MKYIEIYLAKNIFFLSSGQPGSSCNSTSTTDQSKTRSQPVSTVTRWPSTPAVPQTSARKTSILRVSGRNTPTLTTLTTPTIEITPTRLYDELIQE